LVAALADPVYLADADAGGQKTVVIFDNSAEMNIKNNTGKTLFDEARKKLANLINSTSPNHRIAIICTVDGEQFSNKGSFVLAGFTDNKKELQQKITSIRNTIIPANLSNSFELAAKLIELDDFSYNNSADKSNAGSDVLSDSRILVFTASSTFNRNEKEKEKENTDSNLSAKMPKTKIPNSIPNPNSHPNPKIEYCLFGQGVGKTYSNVAITRFQSRLSFIDLSGYELFIELSNFGDEVIETRLKIFVDDRVSDVVSVLLNPREVKQYFVKGEINRGGIFVTKNTEGEIGVVVRGEIDVSDCFDADNTAYTILPPPMLKKILYFGEDNFFLINALKSCIPASQQQTKFERVTKIPEIVPFDSVLVINRNVPPKLPEGNLMIFDPRSGCDLFGVGEISSTPLVIGFESSDSPLLKFTQFSGKELSGIGKLNLYESESNKTPEILLSTVENYPVYLSWNFRNKNKSADANTAIQKINSEISGISEIQKNPQTSDNSDLFLCRVLVFSADISRGDFVLGVMFPVLVGNALSYFRGEGNEPERNYFAGESVILRMGIFSDRVKIKSPSGKTKILPVYSDLNSSKRIVYVGKLSEVGVYEIFEVAGNGVGAIESDELRHLVYRLACNFDNREKKIAQELQVAEKSFEESVVQVSTDGRRLIYDFNNFNIWFLFTFCALFLIICDWCIVENRKS
jgi:hypothetical protein